MKKIPIKNTNEVLYYEELDNGLEVYMIPKKTVNNIYVTFNTKFGSMHNEFIPLGKNSMTKFPSGIAHFLEHKMFARESGIDPMVFYANNGTDVNAATSHYHTNYEFYGPDHLKENLEYLLDFVQSPYLTDENVEEEKGIIEQELKMYDDDPYEVGSDGIRMNIFKNHPIKYNIAGTIEDIYSLTKEELMECYNTFYHPSNMFLIITGNFDPKEAIKIVKDNQSKKSFSEATEIKLAKIKEPDEVSNKYEEKEMHVIIPKLTYGIKIPTKTIAMEKVKRDLYLSILFDSLFGSTSLFYEKMKEKRYVETPIMISLMHTKDHMLVTLLCDSLKTKELIDEINNLLYNVNISEEEFDRKRKVIISSEIYLYEDIMLIDGFIRDNILFYDHIYDNMIQVIKDLNKKEFDSLIKKLNLNNTSVLIVKPMKTE